MGYLFLQFSHWRCNSWCNRWHWLLITNNRTPLSTGHDWQIVHHYLTNFALIDQNIYFFFQKMYYFYHEVQGLFDQVDPKYQLWHLILRTTTKNNWENITKRFRFLDLPYKIAHLGLVYWNLSSGMEDGYVKQWGSYCPIRTL